MLTGTRNVETLTARYGRDIFARLPRTGSLLFSPSWFDERLMEWSMGDENVKTQLFRFVDVLPLLRTPAAISRHLREYFGETDGRLPTWLTLGLRLLPNGGPLGRLMAYTAHRSAERLARKFIAGSNLKEALAAVAAMRRRRLAFTIDLLGEATITEAEADRSQKEYTDILAGLTRTVNTWPANDQIDRDDQGELPRVNVSVKLTSLFSQYDPIDPTGTAQVVLARLRPILREAQRRRAFVNVDMEQYAYKDLTLALFKQVLQEPEFCDWPDVGIAIQAYLRDTDNDLRDLATWAQRRGTAVSVRLVKGAYWDYETILAAQNGWPAPVWSKKWQSDAAYEKLTRFLLEQRRWLRPAFGSHNVRSLAHVLAVAHVLDLPPRSFEIQMLYGMADPIKQVFADLGQRVRVYTPYGELLPGMAYLVRRLLENTANESFLRASFTEHVPLDRLLSNPASIGRSVAAGRSATPDQEAGRSATLDDEAGRSATLDGKAGRSATLDEEEENRMKAPAHPPHNGSASATSKSPLQPPLDFFHEEPLSDFSRADVRRAMQKALTEITGQLGRSYAPVVAGKPINTSEALASVDPSHRVVVVGKVGKASAGQARDAVAAAKAAFPAWRDTPVEKRADCLRAAARIMRRRRFELSAWIIRECGKPWREADGDVAEAIDFCDYYAQEMLRLARPRVGNVPGEDIAYFYEPRGVAVIIAPWNFPLAILCGMAAAALVSGNPTILKPAEQSAVVGAKLMEVWQEAGVPAGVIHYLPGVGEDIGPVLVDHPDVALIAFTGSVNVGLSINKQAAEMRPGQDHVKRVIAEMGGKNAIIVDDDADLDEAVHGVVWSAFGYAGQKCSACSRVIVPEGLHDAFLTRLVEATRSLRVLPADDPGCGVPPVIDREAQQRILKTIAQGKTEARLAFAGEVGPLADEGFFVAPHVFADVPPTSSLAQQEIFGPVLAVLKSRDLTHALELANGTRYALTGGLYSRSPEHLARVKRAFRVGNLYINRKITGALVDRQPFGGFKMSGIGSKAGGPDYLLQFVLPRTITENTLRRGFAPPTEEG